MLILISLVLAGCAAMSRDGRPIYSDWVAFFHPTYEDKNVEEFISLIGTWQSQEELVGTLEFTEARVGYDLEWTLDSVLIVKARVVPFLRGQYLLQDISPEVIFDGWGLLSPMFMLSTHQIGRIDMVVDTLRFSMLQRSWLYEYLAEHPGELEYERNRRGHMLVTSPPKDIQNFLGAHERELRFVDMISLQRVEAKPPGNE